MFIDNEVVTSMLELANELMLIGVFNLAILVSQNYCIIKRIDDADQGNVTKLFMTPFPDYDSEHSPFVLVAGATSLNYINVKSGYMKPLIDQGIDHREGQQVALFK